jgi:hypothetical protein
MGLEALVKRIVKLEKQVRELEKARENCTCCQCRNYTKRIPIKEN